VGDIKGDIHCYKNGDLLTRLDDFRLNSPTLNASLNEILKDGDLEIHIHFVNYSCYDNRNIVLGLEQLPTQLHQESTLIMEICNARRDKPSLKPRIDKFDTAEAYGRAVEKQEWEAVKEHIKIHKELLLSELIQQRNKPTFKPTSLGISRFQQAFEDPKYGWDNFENYLKYQKEKNHTAVIESHWHNWADRRRRRPG